VSYLIWRYWGTEITPKMSPSQQFLQRVLCCFSKLLVPVSLEESGQIGPIKTPCVAYIFKLMVVIFYYNWTPNYYFYWCLSYLSILGPRHSRFGITLDYSAQIQALSIIDSFVCQLVGKLRRCHGSVRRHWKNKSREGKIRKLVWSKDV
jgi:hypothetical protein